MIDSVYVVNQKVFYMYEKYVFFILSKMNLQNTIIIVEHSESLNIAGFDLIKEKNYGGTPRALPSRNQGSRPLLGLVLHHRRKLPSLSRPHRPGRMLYPSFVRKI